jgi:hypothetical protein
MYKPLILAVFSACFLICNISFAQDDLKVYEAKASKKDTKTVEILSVDGKSQRVHIMPDYVHRVLKISCLKDTIAIEDYWGVPPEVHVLGSRFVQVNYEVRGGTGYALGNTMLLCVQHGKLHESLYFLRYTHSEVGDDALGDYKIKIALTGSNAKNYRLNVKVHDGFHSKSHHEKNYNYNNQTVLGFDVSQVVFYQFKRTLFEYNIINPSKGGKQKQVLDGYYPTIILGTEIYYFINNEWFIPSTKGELYTFE